MKEKLLKQLGFYYNEELHQHTHFLLKDEEFDFSSCSIEGIMYVVYTQGRRRGKNEIRQTLRETLKLEGL